TAARARHPCGHLPRRRVRPGRGRPRPRAARRAGRALRTGGAGGRGGRAGAVPVRSAVGALVRKDVRAEVRNLEAVPAMTLFVVSTFVLFHLGTDRDTLDGSLAAGVLWVTLL